MVILLSLGSKYLTRFSTLSSNERNAAPKNMWILLSFGVFLFVWANSLIWTSDLSNWLLENVLTILLLVFLILIYKRYRFSDLAYLLIFFYLCLHVYGSKHTYAENPFGFRLQDALDLSRNHYDRIVHFSFGFLLAYPMREMFLKWWKFPSSLAWALPIEVTLSLGAFYEIIEWCVADLFFKAQGNAYLGLQGDIWDAQKDIFLAFCGAFWQLLLFLFKRDCLIRGLSPLARYNKSEIFLDFISHPS